MPRSGRDPRAHQHTLRALVMGALEDFALAGATAGASASRPAHYGPSRLESMLLAAATDSGDASNASRTTVGGSGIPRPQTHGGPDAQGDADNQRLVALVDLARQGDRVAFGELYDHYHPLIYRFIYYRVGSAHLAEDLVAETFLRALRNMHSFSWQGRDFGAWLTTIARNLATDHFKSGRNRFEWSTEDLQTLDSTTDGPEPAVLTKLTNERLLEALHELPRDQMDCLVMRFLQGLSIAETATVLERSSGAVKQLQLRAVRHLAHLLAGEVLR